MATAALVSVTTGVMKPLLSKLTKLLEEKYVKFKGVRKQIKFLVDELEAMSATLEMLADAEQLDPEKTAWRDKLRELAYDLEDCVDAFMIRVDNQGDGPSGFKRFFRKLKKLKARHDIADQIEELKASVIEASKRHKRYDLAQLENKSRISSVDPRLQALYVDIDKLVGIDVPKKQIIELLSMDMNGPSAELNVVSIAGCGGLGKTTLAKQVYNTIQGQFECAAFVSVSRTPDVRKILTHIAHGVKCTGINTQEDDVQQLIDKLREHLQDKKYLIVIDDVWDAEPWEIIKLALMNKNYDSRVITTTRSYDVASHLSSQGGNVYQMKSLCFEDSKRLLFKRAFGSENLCYTHLGSAPDEILRKCAGLPLAIITISSMLTDQHSKSKWDNVLNDIGSALAQSPGAENMKTILSMSYFDIPHRLRTCLLYFSVYPEDYEIEKQCLINRWIAEGFIHHKEKGQTEYEIGERYFNDLINRSMIQPVYVKYGQAEACRVHDIILDYIKCKAAEENFVTSLGAAEPVHSSKYKVRRLCVTNHNEENASLWAEQMLSQVRSVTIFGQPVKLSLLASTALRVLDLGDCEGMKEHHLASIEKFFNLRYLRLSNDSVTRLPESVGMLQHLQTLDVRSTGIEELPRTITKLQLLAHLFVDASTRFPDGIIGQMLNLEELRKYGVVSYQQGQSIQEFSKLTKLRTLEIYFDFPDDSEGRSQVQGIHNYVGNLLSSCNLHNLYIHDNSDMVYPLSLDSWHPAASSSLLKLFIKEYIVYKVPNWIGSLGNISVLRLDIFCLRPEDVEILGEIPTLLFLKLTTAGGTNGRIVVHGNKGFRSLKYFSLNIVACGTSLEFEAGSMPKLEHVRLKFSAHKMKCLNGAESSLGIQHLSALSKVEILLHSWEDDKEDNDNAFSCVSRAINAAIKTLPKHPTVMFEISFALCQHFETALWDLNQDDCGGAISEWLEFLQIREDADLLFSDGSDQATDGETELEDEPHEKEEEEQTNEEKEPGRKTSKVEEEEQSSASEPRPRLEWAVQEAFPQRALHRAREAQLGRYQGPPASRSAGGGNSAWQPVSSHRGRPQSSGWDQIGPDPGRAGSDAPGRLALHSGPNPEGGDADHASPNHGSYGAGHTPGGGVGLPLGTHPSRLRRQQPMDPGPDSELQRADMVPFGDHHPIGSVDLGLHLQPPGRRVGSNPADPMPGGNVGGAWGAAAVLPQHGPGNSQVSATTPAARAPRAP